MAKGETYEQFTEKFVPKRTTDNCYTPPGVYEAVRQWAVAQFGLEGAEVVCPFYPGGDYEHFPYPEGCVVIDNPPFSIYARIVRFYLARGIRFLLFAPALTQLVVDADVTYLTAFANITYENGALVRTSFTTNLMPGTRLWTAPALHSAVQQAADDYLRTVRRDLYKVKKRAAKKKYRYPDHLLTSATVGRIAVRGVDLRLPSAECTYLNRAAGVELFGGGLLLTERAAAERAAAERVAAERAAAEELIPIEIDPLEPPAEE